MKTKIIRFFRLLENQNDKIAYKVWERNEVQKQWHARNQHPLQKLLNFSYPEWADVRFFSVYFCLLLFFFLRTIIQKTTVQCCFGQSFFSPTPAIEKKKRSCDYHAKKHKIMHLEKKTFYIITKQHLFEVVYFWRTILSQLVMLFSLQPSFKSRHFYVFFSFLVKICWRFPKLQDINLKNVILPRMKGLATIFPKRNIVNLCNRCPNILLKEPEHWLSKVTKSVFSF